MIFFRYYLCHQPKDDVMEVKMKKQLFNYKFFATGLITVLLSISLGTNAYIMAQNIDRNVNTSIKSSENTFKKSDINKDEELLISISGNVTDKKIKSITKEIADDYRIISGKFKIDKNLPKEKQERLKKYLETNNFDTIIAVDVKDNINLFTAKKTLENKNVNCDVGYNFNTTKVDNYGVNDTYSNKQYYLNNIHAQRAWSTFSRSGYREIYVAVIDTGLYTTNKDFSGIYLKNYSVNIRNKKNGVYEKLSDMSVPDKDGHGTHVAGIIAAKGNNSFATVGVGSGWINDCVKIMAIKADHRQKDQNGVEVSYFNHSDLIESIQYAIEHGADVINMSLGSYSYDSAFQKAIDNAYNAGVTVVAAKGNENKDTTIYSKPEGYSVGVREHYPSDYNHVISVSATDANNKLASFSNYGNVDIAAPGTNIYSLGLKTANGYKIMSGTSMATPIVSATVAMIKGININISNAQAENVLLNTTQNIGRSAYFGKGLVDTGYAVQHAKYIALKEQTENIKSVTKTSAGNIKIKWSDKYYSEGYCVSRAISKNGTYSRIASVEGEDYFVDKNVKKGKTYYYRVIGYMYYSQGSGTVKNQSVGYSKFSNIKSIKISK